MDDPAGRNSHDAERREMFAYYDARADTYDEFYRGKGAAIPALSDSYPINTAACLQLVGGVCRGDVLDLACGTGSWLQAVGDNEYRSGSGPSRSNPWLTDGTARRTADDATTARR
jgi:SAM-dependent methyltransferase